MKAKEKIITAENTNQETVINKEKEQAFSSISTKSFLLVMALLLAILVLSGMLSYIIPRGEYQKDAAGMILIDSYQSKGVQGIAVWRVITAPFRVFASSDALTIIMISLFLLIMSGVFNLLDKTDGIKIFIGKTMQKFSSKKKIVVCITTLVFMAFGSFFGLFEELVTLLPIVILFMLSMGFDTMTGLGVCMMAACFGFSAAITNPFSIGLIPSQAETIGVDFNVSDGVWLRILLFAFIYVAICAFLLLHIRKISRNPEKSPSYEIDLEKRKNLSLTLTDNPAKERRIFKIYGIFFAVQLALLLLIACVRAISGYAIPILAVSFLVGGIICGLLVCEQKRDVAKYMGKGALAMLPAVAMIAIASSVKLVMEESEILDTIMHAVIESLRGQSPFVCVILIYFLILFLQLFIGSASAKIFLIMPIVLPVSITLGISPTILALTYCIADGFTDVILPTNPVLLIGLSMANVSYGKWVKWTWLMQLLVFTFTIVLLLFAVWIGY